MKVRKNRLISDEGKVLFNWLDKVVVNQVFQVQRGKNWGKERVVHLIKPRHGVIIGIRKIPVEWYRDGDYEEGYYTSVNKEQMALVISFSCLEKPVYTPVLGALRLTNEEFIPTFNKEEQAEYLRKDIRERPNDWPRGDRGRFISWEEKQRREKAESGHTGTVETEHQ